MREEWKGGGRGVEGRWEGSERGVREGERGCKGMGGEWKGGGRVVRGR